MNIFLVMKRNVFVKLIIQAGLFALLALMVFALKNRIVTGGDCSSCPENGSCPGKKDCSRL
jgi:hypothetical protein